MGKGVDAVLKADVPSRQLHAEGYVRVVFAFYQRQDGFSGQAEMESIR